MTSASPVVSTEHGRDAMNEQRGAVAGLTWALAWLGAIVAMAVTALSAASALGLAGVPDPGWLTTYGVPMVTAVGEICAAIALGSSVFATFFVPPQSDGVLDVGGFRAIRIAATSSLVWCVCAVLMIPLSVSNVSGQPLSRAANPSNLVHAYGQVADARTWLWTAVFAAAAAITARLILRWGATVGVILLVGLSLMPLALTGHSSAGGNHDLATNSLILHVLGATVWMGGLFAVVGYALAGGRWRVLAVRRFSRVATWAIVIVGVSGVINAWVRLSLDDLLTETYGHLVLAKAAALIVLGTFGAWHRRVTIARLDTESAERSLFVRFGLVEVLVFAATVGLAVGLSRTPPPPDSATADITQVESQIGYRIDGPPTVGRILFDWRFDLLFGTVAIILAAVYAIGVRRLRRRGDAWPIGRTVAWLAGCLLLLFTTSSGLGRYSPAMFSMHLLGQLLLSIAVPALLVSGGAITLALRALSPAGRGDPPGPREWIHSVMHSSVLRFLTNPAIAAVLLVGSFYVLYFGGLFQAVVQYHAAHILMDIYFLVSGYVFCWLAIGVDPTPRQVSARARAGMALGSLPLHALFGAILIMSGGVIAETYYRGLDLWPHDLLADEHVGGGIAWIAGEIPLLLIAVALLWRVTTTATRAATTTPRDNSTPTS